MVVRQVDRTILVLGSTQPPTVVDGSRAEAAGVAVVRRRSGGGAVFLVPGEQVWVDVWVPRADPLWRDEPRGTAEMVGEWWASALAAAGIGGLSAHRGPSVPEPAGQVVCFAGVGPGEVLAEGRKLVGLAQWRSRQGALVHGCAYRRWDPTPLLQLLSLTSTDRDAWQDSILAGAVGWEELGARTFGAEALVDALPGDRPWDVASA